VIAGMGAAYCETAADESAEYDEEDDPAGNSGTGAVVAVAVVTAVVTSTGRHSKESGDEENQNGRDFE